MALDNEKLTERPALTNSQDTDIIHVVRGNFSYQKEAQNFNAGSISSLNDVGDVSVAGTPDDYYLKWNGSQWVAQPILLEDLLDVVIDENTIADGQVIAYDSTNEIWQNIDIPTGATELNDLTDVNATSPQNGNILRYDSTTAKWVSNSLEISEIDDVVIDGNTLADGQVLVYDSTEEEWVNGEAGVTVGGADTQVQYNDNGSLGAGAFFTTDKSSKIEVTNEIGILGDGATKQGILKLYCENGNAHYVGIKGPNHLGGNTYELQLPNALPNVSNQILESNENGELSWINTPSAGVDEFIDLTDTPATYTCQSGKNVKVDYSLNPQQLIFTPDYMDFACSDETSDLATGRVFTMICNRDYPYASAVEFSVTTAPTGANLEFDVEKNGTTVYSTTPSIDAGEKLTATATTQQLVSGFNFNLQIGDELRVIITQVGSINAGAGLKATMVYNDRICV